MLDLHPIGHPQWPDKAGWVEIGPVLMWSVTHCGYEQPPLPRPEKENTEELAYLWGHPPCVIYVAVCCTNRADIWGHGDACVLIPRTIANQFIVTVIHPQ